MASEKVKQILTKQGAAHAKNELAFFFRRICYDLKIDAIRWESKLQRFLDRNKNLVGTSSKGRSYARGNMNSQFTADRLSWRVWMDGLRFLGAVSGRVTLELEWSGHRKTLHSMNINLRHAATPEDDIETTEMLEEVDPTLAYVMPESDSVKEVIAQVENEPSPDNKSMESQMASYVKTLESARQKLRDSMASSWSDEEAEEPAEADA